MFKEVNLKEYQEIMKRYSNATIKFVRVTDSEATLYIVK